VAQWVAWPTHARELMGSIPLYGSDFLRPYFISDQCHLRHVNLIRGFGDSKKAINVCCRSVSPPPCKAMANQQVVTCLEQPLYLAVRNRH